MYQQRLPFVISLALLEDGVQTLVRCFLCDYSRRRSRQELVRKNQGEYLHWWNWSHPDIAARP
jgi:hypothetical protein